MTLNFINKEAAPTLSFDVAESRDYFRKSANSFIFFLGNPLINSAIVVGVVIVKKFKKRGNEYSNQGDPAYFPG